MDVDEYLFISPPRDYLLGASHPWAIHQHQRRCCIRALQSALSFYCGSSSTVIAAHQTKTSVRCPYVARYDQQLLLLLPALPLHTCGTKVLHATAVARDAPNVLCRTIIDMASFPFVSHPVQASKAPSPLVATTTTRRRVHDQCDSHHNEADQ